jgi:hypothetical protein
MKWTMEQGDVEYPNLRIRKQVDRVLVGKGVEGMINPL